MSASSRDIVGSIGLGGNAGSAALIVDDVTDPVGVIGPVGEHDRAFGQVVEQKLRHRGVVGLPGRERKLHRQAIANDTGVQLGGQSSATSTDTSVSTLFFCAAAC